MTVRKPVTDPDVSDWLVQVYLWALENFEADVFYRDTVLVQPTNEYFPGRETSVQGMATLIFEKVCLYSGMEYWPLRLVHQPECSIGDPPVIEVNGPIRGPESRNSFRSTSGNLAVTYDPALISNPEAIIANFAHTLAVHLGRSAKVTPPGGVENWVLTTEVLAIFMGFGLMFANSAFNFNVSKCGSCRPQVPDRRNFLNQYDATYALAIFSVLKGIPTKMVLAHLKKSLRKFYRRAVKEVGENRELMLMVQTTAEIEAATVKRGV